MTDEHMSTPIPDDMPLDKAVPRNSKYITKEDCDPPILVQIFKMTTDQIDGDFGLEDKAVLHFHGDVKPMILGPVNKEMLKAITGATNVGEVKNHQIVLFNDPTVMFKGKLVGGVRMRAAVQSPVAAPIPAPISEPIARGLPTEDFNDDIPY